MLRTDNLLQIRRIITTRRRGATINQLSLVFRINCLSFRAVVRLPRPPRLRWCGPSVSRLHHKFLLMPCATHPAFLPLPAENNPRPTILQYGPVFSLALRGMTSLGHWVSYTCYTLYTTHRSRLIITNALQFIHYHRHDIRYPCFDKCSCICETHSWWVRIT